MSAVCEVCGNDIVSGVFTCPYCGSKNEGADTAQAKGFSQKTINLEVGRPLLETALGRMTEAIEDAKRNNVHVLTLIHGYGSSGKGGVIRVECRKTLDFMKARNRIKDFVYGEHLNKRSAPVKNLLRRYPELSSHQHMNRENKGITLVILK